MNCWQGYLYPRGLQIPRKLWPRNVEFSLIIQLHSSEHHRFFSCSLGNTEKLQYFQLHIFQSLKLNCRSVFLNLAKFMFDEVDIGLVEKVILRRQPPIFPGSVRCSPLHLNFVNKRKYGIFCSSGQSSASP